MPIGSKFDRSTEDRLQRLTRNESRGDAHATEAELKGHIDLFPTIARLIEPTGRGGRLRTALARAGVPLRPSEFVGLSAFWVVVLALAGWLIAGGSADGALIGGVFGVLSPAALLTVLQRRRLAQLQVQLPDALMIMAAGVRSGFSFTRCLQLVSEEMKPPIGTEFARTVHEIALGRSTQEALGRLVQRTDSYDIDLCVTAVTIQIEVGGNLATVLETIAETIRERFRLRGEIKSLTAEGRLSGWVLFLAPIGLFLFLLRNNPEYINVLIQDELGRWFLVAAGIMELAGGLIIKKLLDIDV